MYIVIDINNIQIWGPLAILENIEERYILKSETTVGVFFKSTNLEFNSVFMLHSLEIQLCKFKLVKFG